MTVEPVGPTCHRGTRSCFDADGAPAERDDAGLRLARDAVGDDRASAPPTRPAGSYTAALLDGGVDAAGRKVTEEATEVLLAAKDDAEAERAGADRDRRPGRRSPARPPTCCTTRSCCSPSAASRQPTVIDVAPVPPSRPETGADSGWHLPLDRRPISRRRLPIRTSSHSPAIGSGTNAGSATRVAR